MLVPACQFGWRVQVSNGAISGGATGQIARSGATNGDMVAMVKLAFQPQSSRSLAAGSAHRCASVAGHGLRDCRLSLIRLASGPAACATIGARICARTRRARKLADRNLGHAAESGEGNAHRAASADGASAIPNGESTS